MIRRLIRDRSGASAAEYVMVLAIIGSAIAVAAIGLGSAVSGSMNTASGHVATCGGQC